jgi:lipopolysaccharide heptosyltransferase II
MGDLLMSSPAIRALKQSFNCRITILTSSMAGGIARHIPCIDEVLIANVPWVKSEFNEGSADYFQLIKTIAKRRFDAAVVFSVFSQNPMPSIMLSFLAEIPLRLAYCRENPYQLLSHWLPDDEPYTVVRHQVERDLALVRFVGADTSLENLSLNVPNDANSSMLKKMKDAGLDIERPWMIVHPGASETKRLFPPELFISILKEIRATTGSQVVFTGIAKEKPLIEKLQSGITENTISAAGLLSLEEFIALINIAPVVLSVNTGTVHIAAALHTPVVVLYAQSNPQHTPWNVPSKVFYFPIAEELKSKNEILKWVDKNATKKIEGYPTADAVCEGVMQLLRSVPQRQL